MKKALALHGAPQGNAPARNWSNIDLLPPVTNMLLRGKIRRKFIQAAPSCETSKSFALKQIMSASIGDGAAKPLIAQARGMMAATSSQPSGSQSMDPGMDLGANMRTMMFGTCS